MYTELLDTNLAIAEEYLDFAATKALGLSPATEYKNDFLTVIPKLGSNFSGKTARLTMNIKVGADPLSA